MFELVSVSVAYSIFAVLLLVRFIYVRHMLLCQEMFHCNFSKLSLRLLFCHQFSRIEAANETTKIQRVPFVWARFSHRFFYIFVVLVFVGFAAVGRVLQRQEISHYNISKTISFYLSVISSGVTKYF